MKKTPSEEEAIQFFNKWFQDTQEKKNYFERIKKENPKLDNAILRQMVRDKFPMDQDKYIDSQSAIVRSALRDAKKSSSPKKLIIKLIVLFVLLILLIIALVLIFKFLPL